VNEVEINIDEVQRETPKGLLVRIDQEILFVPHSEIAHRDHLILFVREDFAYEEGLI